MRRKGSGGTDEACHTRRKGSGGTDGAYHTRRKGTQAVSERKAPDTVVTQVKPAVITSTKAHRRPVRTNTRRRSFDKDRALSLKLASLRRMASRARTAYLQATACNFKILEATFNSYFLNFYKVQSTCHLLGLFPRDVIKYGDVFG